MFFWLKNHVTEFHSSCFQVLSDDKKRSMYDRYGEDGVKSTVGGQAGAYAVLLIISLPLSVCVCAENILSDAITA